jgi:hypothetical protein
MTSAAGLAASRAEEADVELDEVERFCTKHDRCDCRNLLALGRPRIAGSPLSESKKAAGTIRVNHHLLRECQILVLAMIATWRWDRGDQLPNGRQLAHSGSARFQQLSNQKGSIPGADSRDFQISLVLDAAHPV